MELCRPQQFQGDLLIDGVIFGEKDARSGMLTPQGIQSGIGIRDFVAGLERAAVFEPRREPEGAAAPGSAVDARIASHQLRQTAGYGQAETRAAVLPCGRRIGLDERGEQALAAPRIEAWPGVFHFESDQQG